MQLTKIKNITTQFNNSQQFSVKRFYYLSGILFLMVGFSALSFPIIDGWAEIVFPGGTEKHIIAQFIVQPIFIGIAAITYLSHLTLYLRATTSPQSRNFYSHSLYTFGLLLLLIGIYFVFDLGTIHRIDGFKYGGYSRVLWAGGTDRVKQEAEGLIANQTISTNLPVSQWPPSLSKLGGTKITIDRQARFVKIRLPQTKFFHRVGDELGYYITADISDRPAISYGPNEYPFFVYGPNGHRVWELSDGIYLYQIW